MEQPEMSQFQSMIRAIVGAEMLRAGLSDDRQKMVEGTAEVIATLVSVLGGVIVATSAGNKAMMEELFDGVDMKVRESAGLANKLTADLGLFEVK
jgi:uncharacterized membrane protein YqiK